MGQLSGPARLAVEWIRTTANANPTTLDELGGRTGIMLADRQPSS